MEVGVCINVRQIFEGVSRSDDEGDVEFEGEEEEEECAYEDIEERTRGQSGDIEAARPVGCKCIVEYDTPYCMDLGWFLRSLSLRTEHMPPGKATTVMAPGVHFQEVEFNHWPQRLFVECVLSDGTRIERECRVGDATSSGRIVDVLIPVAEVDPSGMTLVTVVNGELRQRAPRTKRGWRARRIHCYMAWECDVHGHNWRCTAAAPEPALLRPNLRWRDRMRMASLTCELMGKEIAIERSTSLTESGRDQLSVRTLWYRTSQPHPLEWVGAWVSAELRLAVLGATRNELAACGDVMRSHLPTTHHHAGGGPYVQFVPDVYKSSAVAWGDVNALRERKTDSEISSAVEIVELYLPPERASALVQGLKQLIADHERCTSWAVVPRNLMRNHKCVPATSDPASSCVGFEGDDHLREAVYSASAEVFDVASAVGDDVTSHTVCELHRVLDGWAVASRQNSMRQHYRMSVIGKDMFPYTRDQVHAHLALKYGKWVRRLPAELKRRILSFIPRDYVGSRNFMSLYHDSRGQDASIVTLSLDMERGTFKLVVASRSTWGTGTYCEGVGTIEVERERSLILRVSSWTHTSPQGVEQPTATSGECSLRMEVDYDRASGGVLCTLIGVVDSSRKGCVRATMVSEGSYSSDAELQLCMKGVNKAELKYYQGAFKSTGHALQQYHHYGAEAFTACERQCGTCGHSAGRLLSGVIPRAPHNTKPAQSSNPLNPTCTLC